MFSVDGSQYYVVVLLRARASAAVVWQMVRQLPSRATWRSVSIFSFLHLHTIHHTCSASTNDLTFRTSRCSRMPLRG